MTKPKSEGHFPLLRAGLFHSLILTGILGEIFYFGLKSGEELNASTPPLMVGLQDAPCIGFSRDRKPGESY